MTGRYEGQQPNTEQDGEKLLRIMAMAAKADGMRATNSLTTPPLNTTAKMLMSHANIGGL